MGDAEKLTVMFSAPRRKEGVFVKLASQHIQGKHFVEMRNRFVIIAGRMGAQLIEQILRNRDARCAGPSEPESAASFFDCRRARNDVPSHRA